MKTLPHLFEKNIQWSKKMLKRDKEFFKKLEGKQKPKYLWIGCADSRVPPNQICGLEPGEMFVHRNIANLVSSNDLNCLSVIEYAVNFIGIKDIIVCGHYNCGGIKSAVDKKNDGIISYWTQGIKNTYVENSVELEKNCKTKADKIDRLCELNVEKQVLNIASLPIVQKIWNANKKLTIHGWIYDLKNGTLKNLKYQHSNDKQLVDAIKYNFD